MARRQKKGRKVTGWLVVDKPAGVTSTAVVNRVRRAFDAQKAGHAGTLDPTATGLLAIAFGDATKTIPYVTDALKAYRFTVRLGQATNTDDAEGEITATSDLRPTDAEIDAALAAYRGDIEQVPPQFSAVKIDGERAYARARDGEVMEIAARPLFVQRLELIGRPDADHAELEMVCGKGGYVRSIARDLGGALGCLGHVVALRRMWSGPFDVAHGVTPDEVEEAADMAARDGMLLPMQAALTELAEARMTPEGAAHLRNGNPGAVAATDAAFGDEAWASYQGRVIAVGTYMAGALHPSRVFGS